MPCALSGLMGSSTMDLGQLAPGPDVPVADGSHERLDGLQREHQVSRTPVCDGPHRSDLSPSSNRSLFYVAPVETSRRLHLFGLGDPRSLEEQLKAHERREDAPNQVKKVNFPKRCLEIIQ